MKLHLFAASVVRILEQFQIRYAIVGGFAKTLYWANIKTHDLDILIDDSSLNRDRFVELMDMQFSKKMTSTDFLQHDMLRVKATPYSIDFHFRLDGVSNVSIFNELTYQTINGQKLAFISQENLIINLKQTAIRHGIYERHLPNIHL
jgi:hypothetical protein